MARYKVPFSGFAFVEASSAEDALDAAIDDALEVLWVDTEYGDPVEVNSVGDYGEGGT